MKEEKRNLWTGKWVFPLVTFIAFLIHLKTATAADMLALKTAGIPIFIHFFLLLNLFLLSVATIIIVETKSRSFSNIWNNLYMANFATMIEALTLTIILVKQYSTLNTNILLLIALFYTSAIILINIAEYLVTRPVLKKKMNLMKK